MSQVVMVKRILTVVLLVAAFAIAAFFTALNPGEITLDLAFTVIRTSVGLAFVLAIVIGWLLGVLSAMFWVARISLERRRLRVRLKNAPDGAAG
jgi:lipopolysaccharide assembly protein A